MGVKYVVVRDDLDRAVLEGAWPARVNQALASSPGMTEVATFGPLVGSAAPDDATNLDPPYPAVEIYQVGGAEPVATVQPAAGTLRVYGAPESVLTLADEGLLDGRPVLLDGDGAGLPAAGSVLTDSLRRRDRDFGELRTSYSPTLTATQPPGTFEAAGDYLEPSWSQYLTVARYTGIKDVTASSSASDIQTLPGIWGSGLLPYAAVDGDLRTRWESGDWTGPAGQWIQVTFDAPVNPGRILVTFVDNGAIGPPVSRVVVRTAAGQVTDPVQVTDDPQWLRVPAGASGWLRITVTGLAWPPDPAIGTEASISDILIPGVKPGRTIVAPVVPGGDPFAVVLAKAEPQPAGCMLGSLGWACDPALAAPAEEQYGFSHAFYEHSPERTGLTGSAVLIDPSLADTYARLGPRQATVTASSVYTGDPQDQARSAFDGNPATSWIASSTDQQPTLTVRWEKARTIRRVTIDRPRGDSGLLQVMITGSAGQARGAMITGASRVVSFAPMRTTSLTFTFSSVQAPLQITDVAIPGVPVLTAPSLPFRLRCGLGPLLRVDGKVVPTRVSGTFAALLTGQPMRFTACSPAVLAAGVNQVTEPPSDTFSVQDVVLSGPSLAAPSRPAAAASVKSWTPSRRTVAVTATVPSYLVVTENFNAGWHAVIGGRQLRAVRLDGWKQAWLLPAGTRGLVTLTYQPDRPYLIAMFGGLALLALVMVIGAVGVPSRRSVAREPRQTRRRPRWARLLASLLGGILLLVMGFWLAGYPGAAIVPAATALFAVAARRADRNRLWSGLSSPWLLAGLTVAASAVAAAGQHILFAGASGLVVTVLDNAAPQVICLLIVARLAAALLLPPIASKIEPVPVV
jgi:arabinofuranan 3-O-arabinosyltransferase